MRGMSRREYLSPFLAWALSFGCTVGWGAFLMPGEAFLPRSGLLGTVLGVLIGGAAIFVVAWNYHRMMSRRPGPGGAFAYATAAFGSDHGFLGAWFLCLAYVSLVWANSMAFAIIARVVFGDAFACGWHYRIAGCDVYLGEVALVSAALVAAGALCVASRRLAAICQAAFAVVLLAGVGVCFASALARNGVPSAVPLFAEGVSPVVQVMRVVALAPWLFVGFESISHSSSEFRFPLKRAFAVMSAAVVAAMLVYVALTLLPVLAPPGADAPGAVLTFAAARAALGGVGTAALALAMFAALASSLVGNMVSTGRLMRSMADDGILPKWFAVSTLEGAPRNAVAFVALVSAAMPFFGRTAVGWTVDVGTIGATVAYGYTSAAAFRAARERGSVFSSVAGALGVAASVVFAQCLLLPGRMAGALFATESYLVLIVWCIAGFFFFGAVFSRDGEGRYGRSTVVWVALLVLVFLISNVWLHETVRETAAAARSGVEQVLSQSAASTGDAGLVVRQTDRVAVAAVRGGYVQLGLTALALLVFLGVYAVMREREARLARAKSFFFSTVSHDIRTPLNAIVGFSQMLKAGFPSAAERDQAVDSILLSGKTLLGLVNDILDLSKLEAGRMAIEPEPTDCARLFGEIVESFRVAGGGGAVELRCRVGGMPRLMLDPQRLRQIAFNLLGNAVKFTERGHVELRASFAPDAGGERGLFTLAVSDTGCGISEADKKRVFTPYVQVGSKKSRNGGTGLGLAICRQLAKAMNGEMTFESEQGKGTVFTIAVPGVAVARAAAPEAAPSLAPSPCARVGRVLIVDDSKTNLLVLVALLKRIGVTDVSCATNGREALDVLRGSAERPFDAVLTDMWMPELDGDGLLRAIRADARFDGVAVYAVTADVELKNVATAQGFDDVLLKPLTLERLATVFAPPPDGERTAREKAANGKEAE